LNVTNAGGTTVNIAGISVTGEFAETNTCGTGLAAQNGCGISVTFSPTGAGTRTGTLMLVDSATNSPQVINLSGKGNNGNGH